MAFQINPIQTDSIFREEETSNISENNFSNAINLEKALQKLSYVSVKAVKSVYGIAFVGSNSKRKKLITSISPEIINKIDENKANKEQNCAKKSKVEI